MAKVIVFYIPSSYKSRAKYTPIESRGRVLSFRPMWYHFLMRPCDLRAAVIAEWKGRAS